MYNLIGVSFKNTVSTGELFILSVDVSTWDFIKKQMTWETLKKKYVKWGDLIDSK